MHLPDVHSNSDISDQINTLLGGENRCVVFDARGSFNERLFAAAAGTITAGGLLVLQAPPLASWPTQSQSHDQVVKDSAFIKRLTIKLIEHHVQAEPSPSALSPRTAQPADFGNNSVILVAALPDTDAQEITSTPDNSNPLPAWRAEQDLMVNNLLNHLQEQTASVAVIQGDRGRGKSALIGRALRQFAATNAATQDNSALRLTVAALALCYLSMLNRQIQFFSIDKALETTHDILVVEEAGSIPIPVLRQLISISRYVIFATTVQGYEGAGRGFAIRFAKTLTKFNPGWLKLNPIQPVRWSPGDPLESFVNSALLLEAELPPLKQANSLSLSAQPAQVTLVEKHSLASDDKLLEEIYGLLVQAHYQNHTR